MDFVASWIILPSLLVALSLGVGLLVGRLAGVALPGGLTVAVGFGATLLVLSVPYSLGFGTAVATPMIFVIAAIGFWLGRESLATALPDRWAGLGALAAYGLYMAPVVLSGETTFAGYTFLGDNSVHFSLVDYIAQHGTHRISQPSSSFSSVTDGLLSSGYPLGLHFLLASLRGVVGLDVAFVYQPFVAAPIAMAVLPAAVILRRGGFGPRAAAALSVIAVGAYLPYSYALQGGMKEMAMILFILVAAVLADGWLTGERPVAMAVVLGLNVSAAFSVYSFGALPWFGLMLGVMALVVLIRRRAHWRSTALAALACAGAFVVAALPELVNTARFLGPGGDLLTSSTGAAVGNLLGPIRLWQAFGVWLGGDYRIPPADVNWTYALIGVVAALALAGLLTAIRSGQVAVLLVALTCFVVWLVLPAGLYIEAKLLTILSPAILLLAFLGVRSALGEHRVLEAALLAVAVGIGVLYSDALAYRAVYLAPVPRLEELQTIDERFAGQGPAMLAEFEEYGKHFLRDLDVNSAYEAYTPLQAQTRTGEPVYARWVDLDGLQLAFVERYPLLIQRRSPVASRPPADFELAFRGHYYDVWRRRGRPRVIDHLPAGTDRDPTGRVSCKLTRQAASAARNAGGELVAALRPRPIAMFVRKMAYRPGWVLAPNGQVVPKGPGRIIGELRTQGGPYRFWMRGEFGRGLTLFVDGRRVGRAQDVQTPGGMALIGEARLARGRHRIDFVRYGGNLAPANARDEGYDALFAEPLGAPTLRTISASDAAVACHTRVDWIEVVRR
jgi:hypothetical protein